MTGRPPTLPIIDIDHVAASPSKRDVPLTPKLKIRGKCPSVVADIRSRLEAWRTTQKKMCRRDRCGAQRKCVFVPPASTGKTKDGGKMARSLTPPQGYRDRAVSFAFGDTFGGCAVRQSASSSMISPPATPLLPQENMCRDVGCQPCQDSVQLSSSAVERCNSVVSRVRMQRRRLYAEHLGRSPPHSTSSDEALPSLSRSPSPPRAALMMSASPTIKAMQLSVHVDDVFHVDLSEERRPCCSPHDDLPQPRGKEVIGAGGFGQVFLSTYNGRQVATKQLHSQQSSHKHWQILGKSLMSELNAFNLNHAHLTRIVAFTSTSLVTQVVYEYVIGESLGEALFTSDRPFSALQRLQIGCQLSSALAYCHSRRIVHLDVKPHNVLIVHTKCTRADVNCKLADFGCSRRLHVASGVSIRPTPGGTLMYTAPEVHREGRATTAADVYSLAMSLWQVATRRALFEGMHAHQVVFNVVTRRMRPNIATPIDKEEDGQEILHHQLMQLLPSMWSADVTERPSAQTVNDTLQTILSVYEMEKGGENK